MSLKAWWPLDLFLSLFLLLSYQDVNRFPLQHRPRGQPWYCPFPQTQRWQGLGVERPIIWTIINPASVQADVSQAFATVMVVCLTWCSYPMHITYYLASTNFLRYQPGFHPLFLFSLIYPPNLSLSLSHEISHVAQVGLELTMKLRILRGPNLPTSASQVLGSQPCALMLSFPSFFEAGSHSVAQDVLIQD